MENKQAAEAFLAGINTLNLDAVASYCTNDFTYSGPLPKPVNLQEWRGLASVFLKAFPDWNFNATVVREEGNVVHVTVRITGTQNGELNLTPLGMGVIPATGKSITLPQSPGRVTFAEDKIANFHLDVGPGAGIPGILAQLGVKPS
ncbi:MAG: nuclear transport factor 2 family protein [Chloroflexi bacterium]|nr:nuclear transport factor 2 family protein [Chloroflexota bacterium]